MREEIFNIDMHIKNCEYLKTIFNDNEVSIEKIDDGMLNNIYKIFSSSKCVIIKQYPDYIIRDDKKIKLPLNRVNLEYSAIKKFKENTPRNILKVLFFDEKNSLIILQYLENYLTLEYLIHNFIAFDNISFRLSDSIARNLVFNSFKFSQDKKEFYNKFINLDMKNYLLNTLFFINPSIVEKNKKIKKNLDELEYKFINKNETLLHGNLKTSSIMIRKENFFLIDFDACFLGPYGFELSYLIASFIKEYIYCKNIINNYEYAKYLLIEFSNIIVKFEKNFSKYYFEKSKNNLDIKEIMSDSFAYGSLQLLQTVTKLHVLNKEVLKENEQNELLEFTKHINKVSLFILENYKDIKRIEDLLVIL
ncbi:MAG: hypothetical protein ACNI25_15260 [Halarcobacter sp.]